jgi:tRNA A-37 threonylcarbamoyl transferase component Bud32
VTVSAQDLPPGYGAIHSAGGAWVGRLDCLASLRAGQADFLLEEPGRPVPASGEGRGPVSRFVLGGHAVIGKRSRHGGAARFFGGIFFGRRRGLDQIGAAERLRRASVATPAILAVGFRAAGPLVRSQAVIAEEVDGALSLLALARRGVGARCELLREIGEAVRRMHDAGFWHADLNVGNLLHGEAPAGRRIYVVDLEKGVFLDRLSVAARAGNLARLLRSYLKWFYDIEPLTARQELRFLHAYCRADRALLRELHRRLQRRRRTWFRVRRWLRRPYRPASSGGPQ